MEARATPAFIIAGTHSGVGKTTTSLILMAALRGRGYQVQPFKIGPDFIDPGYHRRVTERSSINLDLWMMGLAPLRRSFSTFASGSDVAIIESMGALHDGENGTKERGSASFLARKLGIPVVLVIDIWGMTRSTGAVLRGFMDFDPRVRISGFILNRAGSKRHYQMVLDSLPPKLQKLSLGYILHTNELAIPERHLGLLTVEENSLGEAWERKLREAGQTLDLENLERRFRIVRRRRAAASSQTPRFAARCRLAVARDQAFCFYYPENLQMLEAAGAQLQFFSPVKDARLPPGTDGLYLGGGYPESFAAELARNTPMREEIAARAHQGMPIYAECGGLMYLGQSLTGFDGARHPMASVLPLDFLMDSKHLSIKYVEVKTTRPTLLGPAGTTARGQEFHQSRILHTPRSSRGYRVTSSMGEQFREGFLWKNVLGSYVHLHFRSNPSIPDNWIKKCLESR
ncbi:cobyrinate a,c-diamide synthase [Hyalangium versicolor]|uniref:cobyrinate a,c-diamide synthase n=1 Tax=Hyalangium versicolor TaxID=2861190 RepID=UPI001CCA5791|nr:cobyrinate a,c-diamide synthase [Hyalangium versicolor]